IAVQRSLTRAAGPAHRSRPSWVPLLGRSAAKGGTSHSKSKTLMTFLTSRAQGDAILSCGAQFVSDQGTKVALRILLVLFAFSTILILGFPPDVTASTMISPRM